MFDKVTKYIVEAVYVSVPGSSKKSIVAGLFLPVIAILISLSGAAVSYWAYSSNQEAMSVRIQRDETSAIEIGYVEGAVYPDIERTPEALLAKWNVSIINTSLTATIPITTIRIANTSFVGNAITINPDEISRSSQTTLNSAGGDVEFTDFNQTRRCCKICTRCNVVREQVSVSGPADRCARIAERLLSRHHRERWTRSIWKRWRIGS
jgi:hypothetical protein